MSEDVCLVEKSEEFLFLFLFSNKYFNPFAHWRKALIVAAYVHNGEARRFDWTELLETLSILSLVN